MALTLPSSPSDGQQVTYENTRFTFSSAKNVWTREMLSGKFEVIVPTSNTSLASTAIADNKLVLTQADGSTSNVSLQAMAAGSLSVYANESDLPSTGIQAGDHAFVSATNDLYIRTASQWRNIDAINLSPSVSMSLSSHSFSTAGETIDVTYTTNEPEGTPVTITVANTGLSSTNEATITHHPSNNTVTMLAGNSPFSGAIITIAATDGTNIGTGTVNIDFTLGWGGLTFQQKIQHDDFASNDDFGRRVELAGDYLITGALSYDGTTYENDGAAFIFHRTGTTWTQQTRLEQSSASHMGHESKFGMTATLNSDGTEAFVSRRSSSPAIYVYNRSGSTWTESQRIDQPTGVEGSSPDWAHYGSMSVFGNYLVVGARKDIALASESERRGSTWIYHKSGGTWALQQEVQHTDQNASFGNTRYGGSVKMINESTMIAGAYGYYNSTGAVYVFNRSQTAVVGSLSNASWVHKSPLTYQAGMSGDANANRPYTLGFKPDGTKAYIADANSKLIYQYSLSTPYEVTDASMSYDGVSFSLQTSMGGSITPTSMKFKPDGTKLFVLNGDNDTVYEYNLSTPYDLSTTSYNSITLSVSSVEGFPEGIFFKPDGTKMYVVGAQFDSVRMMDLSTPWDISTATYNSANNFSVNSEDSEPVEVVFDSNGTKMYMLGGATRAIYSYTLSSAWDVTTAIYDNEYYSVASGTQASTTGAKALALSADADENKLFVVGTSRDEVNRIDLPLVFTWSQAQKLQQPLGINGGSTSFGWSVGGDSNHLIIGAPGKDTNTGIVYVYKLIGGIWTYQTSLVGSAAAPGQYFGSSVDLRGDKMLISQYAGHKVYVFSGSGSSWTEDKILEAGSDSIDSNAYGLGGEFPKGAAINRDTTKDDIALGSANKGIYIFTV